MRPTSPGRRERPAKSPLSREAVVKAALAILKQEGIEKVTMRRIAAALETGPASLYVYVRDTHDLHAQILDAMLADFSAPAPGPLWRADLMSLAEGIFAVLMRHPEVARLAMSTHSTGPNTMRLLDALGGLLLEAGLDPRAAAWGVDLVLSFVTSTVVEHSGRRASDDAELDEDLREMQATLDPSTHPHLARLGPELFSGDSLQRFRWGLDALVSGMLASSGRGPAPSLSR